MQISDNDNGTFLTNRDAWSPPLTRQATDRLSIGRNCLNEYAIDGVSSMCARVEVDASPDQSGVGIPLGTAGTLALSGGEPGSVSWFPTDFLSDPYYVSPTSEPFETIDYWVSSSYMGGSVLGGIQRISMNFSGETSWNEQWLPVPAQQLVVFDLNGDGLLDVTEYQPALTNPVNQYRINDGNGHFHMPTSNSGLTNPDLGPREFEVDLDADGDLETVVGPDAADGFTRVIGGQALGPNTLALAVGDVDGNGAPDIVRADNDSVELWLNDGSATFTLVQTLASPPNQTGNGGTDVLLLDADNDGDLDLWSLSHGRTSLWHNELVTADPSWFRDADGDGFGSGADRVTASAAPAGYVANLRDCDDTSNGISPDGIEIPYDGIDQDCDGLDLTDADGDGYAAASATGSGPDCDDTNAAINPFVTDAFVDGVDQNCNGRDGQDVCQSLLIGPDGSPPTTPSVVTPNDDGVDDTFGIAGSECLAASQLSVFNRWGELVFQSTDPGATWDGTHRTTGLPVGMGVYVYQLNYTLHEWLSPGATERHDHGSFTLIR